MLDFDVTRSDLLPAGEEVWNTYLLIDFNRDLYILILNYEYVQMFKTIDEAAKHLNVIYFN